MRNVGKDIPGCSITCKVTPRSSRSEIVEWDGDTLKVRLNAIPDKGKANVELIRVLAKALGVAKSSIDIVSGHTSRTKRVVVEGVTPDDVKATLSLS